MLKKHLFVPGKRKYIHERKRLQGCILCGILNNAPDVVNLTIYKSKLFSVSLNLYPYNPGHVMLFPNRHIVDPRELTIKEVNELYKIQNLTMDVLEEIYNPRGFTIGFNVREASGASIEHLHLHIVPRYYNELGFLDIIGGSKIIVEDPNETKQKLTDAFVKKLATLKKKP
ncbi:MAG: HIT domain-containing protein [bacterium]|nr:HIT domain-containing protein [bacterium]